ncbi:MAG: cytochrome C [Gallionellales bacterium 35-53-114]|jgi:cytochrome c|nr:MAG: cytochrome C [Gallionellales bacterium 35-53-114]OYZ64527.1 MAG: cytochrome C [Gallionellales bacterium 24-53-125]OZB10167.1 MAG: cytochrome C [Gallionellales bacterium 39-52-133]HQS56755.1 c-type cytochrome [Gallionellaceae bacterium]HQS75461.1 c-type cytochrome [Gallionellaceae bacterium]
MYKLNKAIVTVSLLALSFAAAAESLPGIGRTATPKEIAAWDIDVRGDFKGIPKGAGSVSLGNQVWDDKCASCHGTFGESMEVFGPIVGGTTKEDMKTGRVLSMQDGSEPKRSTLMKVNTLSTIWDYINRAMPWNAPKTLTVEEVYAVTAYILHMGDILPANYVLSDKNIAEVQKLMPNRNGMTTDHGMWSVKGKGDVKNVACMKDCIKKIEITSVLPDYACDAHGDIAEQNRHFGATRGADKLLACNPDPSVAELNRIYNTPYKASASKTAGIVAITKPVTVAPKVVETTAFDLLKQYKCTACHGVSNKIVGPGFKEIAVRYKGDAGAEARLSNVVKNGGGGVWGGSMPAHGNLKDEHIKSMIQWILTSAK